LFNSKLNDGKLGFTPLSTLSVIASQNQINKDIVFFCCKTCYKTNVCI